MSDESKPKPIDVSKINLELMKLKTTDIPSLLEYAHTVGGFSITPTNQGQIKSHARSAMLEQTDDQLNLIFEQMKTLAKQVQDIKKRVQVSDLIYNAEIAFTPVIGQTYYLYEKKDHKKFLSLLSPVDLKDKISHFIYIAEVKLNSDHTWKVIHSTIEIN
jgi:hypothetical protein